MKVPLYENTVEPNQVAVPTPEFTKPPVDAFGDAVGRATEQQGRTVMALGEQLANHMLEFAKLSNDEKARDIKMQLNDYYRTKMYADGVVDVKDPTTGSISQIPAGYMRRTFHQADSAANELRIARDTEVQQKFIEPYKDNPYLHHLITQYADVEFEHAFDKTIAHVAQQQDLARKFTAMNLLKTQVNQFGDAKDDADALRLLNAPGGIKDAATAVEQLTGVAQDAQIAKAIQNYAITRISPTGDTTEAQGALASFRKELSTYDADTISNLIESHGIQIKKHFEFAQTEAGTKEAMNILTGMAAGKAIPSAEDISASNMPTEWKTAFAEAIRDYQDKDRQGTPEKGMFWWKKPAVKGAYEQGVAPEQLAAKNVEFTNMAANILKMPDQQAMVTAIIPVIRDSKLSQDEKTSLVELVIQRSKGLATVSHETGLDGAPNPAEGKIPLDQQSKDSVINQLMQMKDELGDEYPEMFRLLNQAITDFKIDPQNAFDTAIAQHNLRKYPKIFENASENGTEGWDRFGNHVIVYKDGRVVRKK